MSRFLGSNRRITAFALLVLSVLFLGIGCTGDQGLTAPQGAQGPQGPAGAVGPAGPAGPAGQALSVSDTGASGSSVQPGQSKEFEGEVKIEWLTWSFYRITTPGGKVILTNPWYTNPDSSIGLDDIPEADIILVPAGHPDEVGNTLAIAAKTGAAVVAFKATRLVQVGGLVTWQGSFAGDEDRPSTSILAAQPFGVWQLGKGTYLRSTGVWNFDLESGEYAVPIGFGIGHVLRAGGVVYNIFLEPQFTILHDGTGQPKIQLFAGLNLQFPKS